MTHIHTHTHEIAGVARILPVAADKLSSFWHWLRDNRHAETKCISTYSRGKAEETRWKWTSTRILNLKLFAAPHLGQIVCWFGNMCLKVGETIKPLVNVPSKSCTTAKCLTVFRPTREFERVSFVLMMCLQKSKWDIHCAAMWSLRHDVWVMYVRYMGWKLWYLFSVVHCACMDVWNLIFRSAITQ